jgi:ankyrin repeat protein
MRIPLDENGDEIESQFDSFSNSAGQSPADIAFCARNMEMMINLAQKRILPLKTDQDGMSAIQYACRASNSALIRSLLSTSSHSVVNSSTDAKQHLEILVWEEQSELLEIVLSLCDKSEIESFFNRASSAGQHHVVERILSTRAFDMQNTWDAAWKACCEHDFHEVARVLLRYWKIYYGINLPEYHTAIEKANSRAAVVGATGCLRCLIQEAWNVCFQKSGIERMAASCLSQAIKSKTLSTVELLLKDGGLNGGELQDQRHNPPILFLAISSKSLPITKAIVREGVNLSNIFQNQSALDWSTNHGSEAITAYLKDKGCKSTGLLPLVNQTRSPNRSLALTTEPFLELPSHRYHNREDVILPSRLNESVEVRRGDQNRDSNQLVELEGDFYMPDEFHRQSIISDIEVPTSDTLVRSISLRQSRNTSPLPPSSSAYQLTDQYSYPVHEQRSNNMRTSPGSLRTDRQEDEPQIESSGTARQERSKSKKPGLRGQDFERIRRIFQNKSKRRH